MLRELGIALFARGHHERASILPEDLDLVPTSRWPTILPDSTVRYALAAPVPVAAHRSNGASGQTRVSIVIVSHDNLVFTKLCLASVLSNTDHPDFEVLVVDNGSTDGTQEYLHELASHHPNICVLFNDINRGFAPGNNQGLALATGGVLVLLNNDTIVPPGWLGRLTKHLADPAIGLVGPVTNRAGNEAEVEAPYRTYREFLDFARDRTSEQDGRVFDIRVTMMFCVAMRRRSGSVWVAWTNNSRSGSSRTTTTRCARDRRGTGSSALRTHSCTISGRRR